MKITIHGDTPSKKNSRIILCRGGKPVNIPSKHYREWHKDALWQLREQKVFSCPYKEIRAEIEIFPKTKRKADLTNKAESVMDLLVDAEVLEDDNWYIVKEVRIVFGGVDKDNPRAEFELKEIEEKYKVKFEKLK